MLFVCFAPFLQVVGVGEEEMLEMSHIFVSESHDSFGGHLPGRKSRLVVFGVTVHLLRVVGTPLGFLRAGDQARPWAFSAQ